MVHWTSEPRIGVIGLYGAVTVTWTESSAKLHGLFGVPVLSTHLMSVATFIERPGIRPFWMLMTVAVSALDPGVHGVGPAHGWTDVTRAISRAAWDTPLNLYTAIPKSTMPIRIKRNTGSTRAN